MAHAVVEWTDNLATDGFEIRPLLSLIAAEMRDADGVFPLGGIRVRGIRLEDYVIADDTDQDAFVNIRVLMGAGRPAEFKGAFERRYLALSMYIDEADEAGSFKHNNIHHRFRKAD